MRAPSHNGGFSSRHLFRGCPQPVTTEQPLQWLRTGLCAGPACGTLAPLSVHSALTGASADWLDFPEADLALFEFWGHSVSPCWWTVPLSPASWADEMACCFLLVSYHPLSLKERPGFNFNLCWYTAVKRRGEMFITGLNAAFACLTAVRFTLLGKD